MLMAAIEILKLFHTKPIRSYSLEEGSVRTGLYEGKEVHRGTDHRRADERDAWGALNSTGRIRTGGNYSHKYT